MTCENHFSDSSGHVTFVVLPPRNRIDVESSVENRFSFERVDYRVVSRLSRRLKLLCS